MSASWVCRAYRPGDELGILELYREVFQLDLSLDFWRWFFGRSPDGASVISVIEMDGRIAGQYAVQLKQFWFDGKLCTAGYSGGTMLAPRARNVTTLVEMAKLAYQMCRERNIPWLYGCPNEQALAPRLVLLKWRQLPDVVEWDGPIPQSRGGGCSDVTVWRQWPADLDFDGFIPAEGDRPIQSSRSTAWVRWKFFERPGGEYVLHTLADNDGVTGYAVTKRYRRDDVLYGHMVDWKISPIARPRAADLLSSVWRQLAEWNVERVSCWAAGDDHLAKAVSEAGLTLTGRNCHVCYYDLEGSHERLMSSESSWKFVMVDCDVY